MREVRAQGLQAAKPHAFHSDRKEEEEEKKIK
jgi:hypothetical protein